ncbi:hypothetical protein Btru_037572 [Bulinus truncatus]|nr:hypothetical protein Btru_037572 [Bulinus truncatus]
MESFRRNHYLSKKLSVGEHLEKGSRKRKEISQSFISHKKKRKDLQIKNNSEYLKSTGLNFGLHEKPNITDQLNILTSTSETAHGDKLSLDAVEESCSSSRSEITEISESRRPKNRCLLEERDCSLSLNNLFNEGGLATLNTSLTDLSDDSSMEPTVKNVDLPDWMYVALDCEMVGVGLKGKQSVLARCSIVDYCGNVLYDNYIRPLEKITDYRTPWSGIRPSHMIHAIPIQQALPRIRHFLKNKIIIGHAVYNDFNVLGIKPENYMVRDTAQCPRLVHMAHLEGRGNSLKKLTKVLLNRHIQVKGRGHCSVEDAQATLDLFKLVRKQWEPELLSKWVKRDAGIPQKLMELIHSSRISCNNNLEDFLQDQFWPTDLHS